MNETVNEPIATAYPLQKQPLSAVVEKAGIVPGDGVGAVENEAEGKVLGTGYPARYSATHRKRIDKPF